MAYTAKSDVVTAQDTLATTGTKPTPVDQGGRQRVARGFIAAASFVGGTVGQTYAFCRVPARGRLLWVNMINAGVVSGSMSLGFARTAQYSASNALVSGVDLAALVNLATARPTRTFVDTAPSTVSRSLALKNAFATEIGTAGATNDVEFDVVGVIVTVASAGQDIHVEAEYVLGD